MPPDLLSLLLPLRLTAPLPAVLPEYLGRAAHAILLDAVRHTDPALAEALHTGSGLRPFTASNLIGYEARRGVVTDRVYSLRFTALTAPVAQALLAATHPGGPLSEGAAVVLDTLRFTIEAPTPTANPWAAATTYEALSAPWLLGRAAPAPRLTFHFVSPTTFKSAGRHVPVPLPEWVFGSLLEKWNAFAPIALPPEARRFAEECLVLSSYKLESRIIPLKEGGLRVGGVGHARYTATNRDRYWLSVMHLLASFALFAGVGVGTGMGLGQVRQLQNDKASAPASP